MSVLDVERQSAHSDFDGFSILNVFKDADLRSELESRSLVAVEGMFCCGRREFPVLCSSCLAG